MLDSTMHVYDCVHLVFDHYNTDGSCHKATTEDILMVGGSIYICTDETSIRTSLTVILKKNKSKPDGASSSKYLGTISMSRKQ